MRNLINAIVTGSAIVDFSNRTNAICLHGLRTSMLRRVCQLIHQLRHALCAHLEMLAAIKPGSQPSFKPALQDAFLAGNEHYSFLLGTPGRWRPERKLSLAAAPRALAFAARV